MLPDEILKISECCCASVNTYAEKSRTGILGEISYFQHILVNLMTLFFLFCFSEKINEIPENFLDI